VKEKDIERDILDYLYDLPRDKVYFFKVNTVGIYDPVRRQYRRNFNPHIVKGVSDILGVLDGKFVAIEVKTPKTRKRVSVDQKKFLDQVNSSGGIGFVATCIEDVDLVIGKLNRDSNLIF
tara:strand:- start:5021 stop:5380 length:360 start_codon:yes stop_codon:yes gene_type:complete